MVAYDGNGLRQWTHVEVDEDGRHKVGGKETRAHVRPGTKDNGGPAFPTGVTFGGSGMSLRDWFAGQALVGLLAHPGCMPVGDETDNTRRVTQLVSEEAFYVADAMLAARGQ